MRRMATSKQLDYISGLQEVAEKGDKIGTYPQEIHIVPQEGYPGSEPKIADGEVNWEVIKSQVEDNTIDLGNHAFNGYIDFDFPLLFKEYGLGEGGSVGYISYAVNDTLTMPNSVVDFESLKTWMQSQDFINALYGVGYLIDDIQLCNNIATYDPDDPADNILLYNGELKLNTYIICIQGEGLQIIEGTEDPIITGIELKTENLEVTKDLRAQKALIMELQGESGIYKGEVVNNQFNIVPEQPTKTISSLKYIEITPQGEISILNYGESKIFSCNITAKDGDNTTYDVQLNVKQDYVIHNSGRWNKNQNILTIIRAFATGNVLKFAIASTTIQDNRVLISLYNLDGSHIVLTSAYNGYAAKI